MKRSIKTFVAATLLPSLVTFGTSVYAANDQATKTSISPAERAKIEEVVHQYLISKPEVLVEAMQVLQRKQYEQAEETMKKTQQNASQFASALFHQASDPVAGNPNGKITVVEFFDYQCPHCIDMAPVMDAIIKANPDVRVVFKEFPIRGPMSEFAARAALAANKQGKYYPFSHALLTANKPLTQDVVFELAKNSGVDVDKLKKDMNDSSIDTELKNNSELAQKLKLFGTPAFFVGKTNAKGNESIEYAPGQVNQKQMQDLIDKANK